MVDWTKPLEAVHRDGTVAPVELDPTGWLGENPDNDGDYWVMGESYKGCACVNRDGHEPLGGIIRNVGETHTSLPDPEAETIDTTDTCVIAPWVDHAANVNQLRDLIHGNNRAAGWWTDLNTGEPLERNDGEMIALMHSELSEALEGLRKNLMDDHLPTRPMVEVEMADTVIRIMDYCGGRGLDLGGAIVEKLEYNSRRADHRVENRRLDGGKKI